VTDNVKIEEVTNNLTINLGNAVWTLMMAGPKDVEKLEEVIGHLKEEMKSASLVGKEGENLEDAWGEKVYALAAQLNINRKEAVEWICTGTSTGLQYGINFLEREIEELKK
jgi:hypothetical protein